VSRVVGDRALIGGVAVCAAVATFHGAAHAAGTSGVTAPVTLLYPVMGDGLAVLAFRRIGVTRGPARGFAWAVMVVAASASGLAQAYVLAAGKAGGAAVLAAGMGAAPAVCVLLATVLASGEPVSRSEPGSSVSERQEASGSVAGEPAEPAMTVGMSLPASGGEPGDPDDEPGEPDDDPGDELADRREQKPEPTTVRCDVGCGRQVSVATRKRHRARPDGCPAVA
jgi:hypothetical protein